MNLSTAIIDGALKLVQHIAYKAKKENRIRIYDPKDSRVPENIMFESKTTPGVFLDEVTDKQYQLKDGKLLAI